MPLKVELENALEDNFHNLVSISEINFENKLNRYIEGASSLSSRTMIKNELDDYVKGEIGIEEVKNYTQEKYADGAEALHYANSAYRISRDQIIAHWGEEKLELINNFNFNEEADIDIKISRDDEYVIVKSKIINDSSNKIGDDFVVFDLKTILTEINTNDIKHIILREHPSLIHKQIENNKIVEFRRLLNTDYWLRAEMATDLLYENIQQGDLANDPFGEYEKVVFLADTISRKQILTGKFIFQYNPELHLSVEYKKDLQLKENYYLFSNIEVKY